MDPVTHVATGLLLSQVLPAPHRAWAAAAGVAFALLPDTDYFLNWVDRTAFIHYHRGFTHSLLALPLFALAGAAVAAALGGMRLFRPIFLIGIAVLASHLLLDLATSYGTQLLNPLTRRKFTLDWVFIIDPYLTGLLAAGALAALLSPAWGRRLGLAFLAGALGYFLLCGFYHHQALALARQVFQAQSRAGATLAALPQPFSCRRWQLLAAGSGGVEQSFVLLPYLPAAGPPHIKEIEDAGRLGGQGCRVPAVPYRPPEELLVLSWPGISAEDGAYAPEARRVLDDYLDFARFPLLFRNRVQGQERLVQWLDLRFSVPGRPLPFVLQLRLDPRGRLLNWVIGGCAGEKW